MFPDPCFSSNPDWVVNGTSSGSAVHNQLRFRNQIGLLHIFLFTFMGWIVLYNSPGQALPSPPVTPPPNQTRSGGSLSGTQTCGRLDEPLVALVPTENPVLTTSAHPTLLFYVPEMPDVDYGEFSMLIGPDEMTRHYHTRFVLPATSGIVSLRLPETPETAIAENIPYHWYFRLYCRVNSADASAPLTANVEVNGWIQRVPLSPEREQLTQTNSLEIWYDSLAQLVDRLQASPHDIELREQWMEALEAIQAEQLESAPFIGSVGFTD